MAVSKRTRFEVLRRDNFTCRYCGGKAPDVVLTVDHVVPVALGGSDDSSNLVTACRDCNAGKSSTSPSEELVASVSDQDLTWAQALREAADRRAADQQAEWAYFHAFLTSWPRYRHDRLPNDADESVFRLYRAGLPEADMVRASAIALAAPNVLNRFRYFIGVCWNQVTELQEAARQIMAEGKTA